MAIERARVGTIPYDLPSGLRNPLERWEVHQHMPVIVIEDDSGCAGVGQCMAPAGAVKSLTEDLFGPLLMRQDPLLVHHLWEVMYRASLSYGGRGLAVKAMGAIDVALWDLRGQILGRPIHQLLGGCRNKVFAYASGGLYGEGKSPADLAAEMHGYVALGFKAVKMKIGGVPLAEDVERIHTVREAIGPETKLIVDALNSYTAREAIDLASRIDRFDIWFFEAPVALESPDELSAVKQAITIPIAGYEMYSTRFAFRDLIANARVDFIQPNITAVGGITESHRVIETASTFGLPSSLQCAGELEVLSSIHLAAVHPTVTSIEYHMLHQYLPQALRDTLLFLEDGQLQAPATPGLGVPGRRELMELIHDV